MRWAPILALALPGAWLASRLPHGDGRAILAPVAVQVLVATFFSITMRGRWFPGRMLVVVLPLLVPLIALAAARAGPRALDYGPAARRSPGHPERHPGALAGATRGQVTVAVNPFEAGGWWLEGTRPLFPLYTAYTVETWRSARCASAPAPLAWATLPPPRGWSGGVTRRQVKRAYPSG